MHYMQIILVFIQIVLNNSEKCLNINNNFVVVKDFDYGFYKEPQISHYEEGEINT